MTQEEKIVENLQTLGFDFKMDDPMRPTMLDLAESLTKQAITKTRNKSLVLRPSFELARLALMAFAIASLCVK